MIPGEESSEESNFIWELIAPFLEIFVGKGRATPHLVRKLAHFTEFFVLGVISKLTFKDQNGFFKSALLGIVVASIDETIQLFVPGRAGMIKDVLIDSFGCICAVVLFAIISSIYKKGKNK